MYTITQVQLICQGQQPEKQHFFSLISTKKAFCSNLQLFFRFIYA